MSVSVDFYKFSKKRNSTKQPTGAGTTFNCEFKSGTSFLSPTLLLSNSARPDYNYFVMDGWYYFISDIVSVRNNLWEIYGKVDPMATAKTAILAGTQFVSYSSQVGSIYLPDTRIPVITDKVVDRVQFVNTDISRSGSYVLAVNGKNGCCIYRCSQQDIRDLIQNISTWMGDATTAFLDNLIAPGGDVAQAIINAYTVIARSGAFGNAYSEAPAQIKSCIWVPFASSAFTVVNQGQQIYLGQFPTGVYADEVAAVPKTSTHSGITIPWYYTDYRRATCEHLYLYLPLVGLVNIASDNITDQSAIDVDYSIMPTDGTIAYEVKSGWQIIGSYGGNCSSNYPIGISQQASAGDIINSILAGGENMVNAAIHSTPSPVSMTGAAVGVALEGVKASYDTIKVANSRHNTTIGGVGGGVGSGLDLYGTLFNVIDKTIVAPSDMAATMGRPTMKPMSLATLTGYCQCANAHVDADFPAPILDAVDTYLNSGFFIE